MSRSKNSVLTACLVLVIAVSGLVDTAAASAAQPAAPDEASGVGQTTAVAVAPASIYWGASVEGWPDDVSKIDAFEKTVHKRMSIVHWGEPWMRRGRMMGFQSAYFDGVRTRGSIPMLDWGSWDSCCDESQPQFALSTIVNGDWDAYITRWAADAHAWGHPFFLRLDPEMNGWWYPWNEQVNNNAPGDFVQAWQHVHDIFVAQGATNATWVWCPNIVGRYSTPLTGLYPGDDYVDWTCVDGYNWGTDYDNAWQTFTEVFTGSLAYGGHNSYGELLSQAPNKPMMIGETASSENGGSKAAWIRDMLLEQLPTNFPQIKAVVWFDGNSGDPNLSWSVESSPAALQAFSDGISSPAYPDNAYATLDVSPIPPPEYLIPTAAQTPLTSP
jgi:hypothetical protein